MGRKKNKNFTFEVSTEGDGLIFWHWSLKCKKIYRIFGFLKPIVYKAKVGYDLLQDILNLCSVYY